MCACISAWAAPADAVAAAAVSAATAAAASAAAVFVAAAATAACSALAAETSTGVGSFASAAPTAEACVCLAALLSKLEGCCAGSSSLYAPRDLQRHAMSVRLCSPMQVTLSMRQRETGATFMSSESQLRCT